MAEMGEFNPFTNEVVINSARHSSGEEMASTLIHEATHVNRKFNNSIPVWTQYEEYLSFRNELLFNLKRRPTLLERRAEYEKIRYLYPETSMPQGKNPFPLKGN